MIKTYVTFGQSHAHRVNGVTFDKDSVAVIHAETLEEGRALAHEYFDNKFGTTYTEMPEETLSYFPRGLINAN